jgi:uncharacterized membrane protein YeaQ/YmgE (transglycosylase-associated protein family)
VSWLAWILLGLVAGVIARSILPGSARPGIFLTTLLGVLGALVGGFIGNRLGLGGIDEFFDLETWLLAIGGSVLVLLAWAALASRRRWS